MDPGAPTIAGTIAVMVSTVAYASPPALSVQSVFPQTCKEINQMIVRPKNQLELAKNLKFILDHDLALQDEFYTEDNLRNYFNLDSALIDASDIGGGSYKISAVSSKFSAIFAQPNIPGSTNFMPSAHLGAGKTIYKTGAVSAVVNLSMNEWGPGFDETWKIFEGKFIKLDPLPQGTFGGPLPARVPHGNETWRRQWLDDKTEKVLTLGFNRDAELSNILIEVKKFYKGSLIFVADLC